MITRILFSFLFLCSFYNLPAQPSDVFKENLEKDLDTYRDSIWLNHINPFTNISRNEFSKEIERIKKSSSFLNGDELLVELLRLNAKIQDEHTTIGFPREQLFPLYLYWFEEGIYILATDTEYNDINSGKIIAINTFSIEDITKKISELIPGNNSEVKKSTMDYLYSPVVLHGLKIIESVDYFTLTIVKLNGDTSRKKVESKKAENINFDNLQSVERKNQLRENYWYRYDSLSNSLYFHYLRCKADKRKPFDKFQEDLFSEMESRKAKRLIIDLRYNSGGSSLMLNPFIERLWKTDVRRHRELFVLIGRRTFSSAVINAFDLKAKDDAILVGEETGGNVNHFGQINIFKLPNTGMTVSYSTKAIVKDKSLTGPLKPDVVVRVKFSDYINGTDPGLEYAKTH